MNWNSKSTIVRSPSIGEYWLAATEEEAKALREDGWLVAGPETIRAAKDICAVFPGSVSIAVGKSSLELRWDHRRMAQLYRRPRTPSEKTEQSEPEPAPPERRKAEQQNLWERKEDERSNRR